jgi:DNA-binding PadR family transcriptional regulator
MTTALNATAASLLGLLHRGPMTGWDLVTTAQERIGNFWTLTQSQVYRELAKMTDTGLVTVGEKGPRDRKPYTITKAGRKAFADWIGGDPPREQVRVPLLLTIQFSDHLEPGRLSEIIAAQRAKHAARLAEYRANEQLLLRAPEEVKRLATLRFGIRYEQAVLDWFDELPDMLGHGLE